MSKLIFVKNTEEIKIRHLLWILPSMLSIKSGTPTIMFWFYNPWVDAAAMEISLEGIISHSNQYFGADDGTFGTEISTEVLIRDYLHAISW